MSSQVRVQVRVGVGDSVQLELCLNLWSSKYIKSIGGSRFHSWMLLNFPSNVSSPKLQLTVCFPREELRAELCTFFHVSYFKS